MKQWFVVTVTKQITWNNTFVIVDFFEKCNCVEWSVRAATGHGRSGGALFTTAVTVTIQIHLDDPLPASRPRYKACKSTPLAIRFPIPITRSWQNMFLRTFQKNVSAICCVVSLAKYEINAFISPDTCSESSYILLIRQTPQCKQEQCSFGYKQ